MTLEQRYLALIKYCIKNPYVMRPRHLIRKFNLSEQQIYWIGDLLRLEILGFERRNLRYEIEFLIKENPNITAIELAEKTNIGLYIVYSVAVKLGHKFQTLHDKRRIENEAKTLILHQAGNIIEHSNKKLLASRIRNNL